MKSKNTIPVLDWNLFKSNKEEFLSQLDAAFKKYGFIRLLNHGLEKAKIQRLIAAAATFFEQSLESKMKHSMDNGGQTGYVPFKKETAKGFDSPDLKEFYHFAREGNSSRDLDVEFHDAMSDTFDSFMNLGVDFMKAIGLLVAEDENYFTSTVTNGDSILRTLYYPPIKGEVKEGSLRAQAHEDINLITLLIGANASGLEVMDADGSWIEIEPNDDELIINSSDMLSRLTNGVYNSVTHRVSNSGDTSKARISLPFFLHPISGIFAKNPFDLTPLQKFVDISGKDSLGKINSSEFLGIRLYELGLISDSVMLEGIKSRA